MNNLGFLQDYEAAIIDIYKENGLTTLRGLDDAYIVNGKNVAIWHTQVTKVAESKYGNEFPYWRNFKDLLFCSDELLYFTAHLFLYRPFLNNPIEDSYPHPSGNRDVFRIIPNLETRRYHMFIDVVSQKAYNYWDRIGDLIASYFPSCIKPKEVFFSRVIDIIPEQFRSNPNFLWLLNFKENNYTELNEIRKKVVHYNTYDTGFNNEVFKIKEEKEMEDFLSKRGDLATYYKDHISLTIEGFEKTMLFLEELNPILFPDIV